jgi:carbamoyl-phosphate synthase large subunit
MSHNILITSAGKRVVLVKIFQKTLKELGLDGKVYTVDMRPEMAPAGFVSEECIRVPRCTSPDYVDTLLQICEEKQIAIVVPTIDTELMVLAQNRARFEAQGVHLVISDADFIKVCCDKRLTDSLFEDLGIAIPKHLDKDHVSFPMFAKPYDGSLSVNTHIIKSEDELTPDILEDPKLLFMEYIDKKEYKEYTVDMYYGIDGEVKGIVPRERLEVRAGEINKGITRKNSIVSYLKERMATMNGVRGCICLQLFYRASDQDIKGIEINPRFGGGFPLSYYANANFVEYILREYLLNEQIAYSEDWLDHTLMLRYDEDVIIHDAKA